MKTLYSKTEVFRQARNLRVICLSRLQIFF